MTIDPTAEDQRLHLGPVWDYNFGYGNYLDYFGVVEKWEYDNHWWPIWDNIPFWWIRAMEDEYSKTALVCRWREMRKAIITEERLLNHVNAMNNKIRQAMIRNHERWPTDNIPNYVSWASTKDYDTEVDLLKDWIPRRIKWMDRELDLLVPDKLTAFNEGILRPNPTYNGFTLDLKLEKAQDFGIKIFNTTGQIIYNKRTSLSAGFQRLEIYDAILSPGTYFVAIESESRYILKN